MDLNRNQDLQDGVRQRSLQDLQLVPNEIQSTDSESTSSTRALSLRLAPSDLKFTTKF